MEKLLILGCGAALPTKKRSPSSQVLLSNGKGYLIDCGEGTQMKLRESKISFSRINQIFISHLHGDHYFGLPGLISTFQLLGRKKPLEIFCPKGLEEILTLQFKYSQTTINFPLKFHITNPKRKEKVFEDKEVLVYSIPLNHKIHCTGFQFHENNILAKLIPEKVEKYNIPKIQRRGISLGDDFKTIKGEIIPHNELTFPPKENIVYAYCSDNRIKLNKNLDDLVGTTTLYHETTFDDEMKERAKKTFHSTASEAAELARKLNVKLFIAGHFSSRYSNLDIIKKQCVEQFPNVVVAEEGKIFLVK